MSARSVCSGTLPSWLRSVRDFRAAEATRNLDLDAAGAGFHRAHDALLHGATKRDALLELIDDVLTDQTGIEFRNLDLDDVHLDLLAGELLEVTADLVDADAALADDDTRLTGVHDHARLVGAALDLDFRDRGGARHAPEILANRHVFVEPRLIVLFLKPAAVPRARDAETEPDRMDLLSHYSVAPKGGSICDCADGWAAFFLRDVVGFAEAI
jgi:hypothetical protein